MSKEIDREFEGVELAMEIERQKKEKKVEGVAQVRRLEKELRDLDLELTSGVI